MLGGVAMASVDVQQWLDRLGYSADPASLHVRGAAVPAAHLYAMEITGLLKPNGAIRAQAVFDVEGVPTVVFVGEDGPLTSSELDAVRKRIWNQNLATVVIEVRGAEAVALPARKLQGALRLNLDDARPDGPFSALDIATGNLSRRLPKWFDVKARVDRKLLTNLSITVTKLTDEGLRGNAAPGGARLHHLRRAARRGCGDDAEALRGAPHGAGAVHHVPGASRDRWGDLSQASRRDPVARVDRAHGSRGRAGAG